MGFIKEDLRHLSGENFTETKYRVIKYANFISRVIYDMKWYDPPIRTIRSSIFSTDLNEVITFLTENLFKRISRTSEQFHFNLQLQDGLPHVQVNEFVVWEILEPLLQNCIDHSNREEVEISITTRTQEPGTGITVIIEDNGVGIDGSLLETDGDSVQFIFKENVSTKHDQHKNGYGCYIAYELAAGRCGWQIKAVNRKGNSGARFILTIPSLKTG